MNNDKFEMGKEWKADTCFRRVKDLDMKIDPELRKKYPNIDEQILDEVSFFFIKNEIDEARLEGIKLKLAPGEKGGWEIQRIDESFFKGCK